MDDRPKWTRPHTVSLRTRPHTVTVSLRIGTMVGDFGTISIGPVPVILVRDFGPKFSGPDRQDFSDRTHKFMPNNHGPITDRTGLDQLWTSGPFFHGLRDTLCFSNRNSVRGFLPVAN